MKCFSDRAEKITKYNNELASRIYQYTYDYKYALLEIADKRTEAYKQLLYKIHGIGRIHSSLFVNIYGSLVNFHYFAYRI